VALAKKASVERDKVRGTPSPSTLQANQAKPSAEQERLGPGWNHVVSQGRIVKATTTPTPIPTPRPVTENPPRSEVTPTKKKGKTAKSVPMVTVGSKQAPVVKPKKPAKPKQAPHPKEMVATIQPTQSPFEEISDILDNLPLNVSVELTRRLLTSVPSLPSGPALSRAILQTVVLFVAEYGSAS